MQEKFIVNEVILLLMSIGSDNFNRMHNHSYTIKRAGSCDCVESYRMLEAIQVGWIEEF